MQSFLANIADLQPSQLYICAEKLAQVRRDSGEPGGIIQPVPLKKLADRTVLVDGHTRTFAAFEDGRKTIPAYWENDSLDWEAYELCVQWCLHENIRCIADLQTRIISAADYEQLWYKRCRAMHEQLVYQRTRNPHILPPNHSPPANL